jgi:acetylornithine deacetylase/succinyl-diaminopimelate desuccinylase-like protein
MPAPRNVVDLLRDLVAIPSVNPAGEPGTDGTGEQAMADYVAAFLRALGADVRLDEIAPGRPNVAAEFRPESGPARAHFAFAPHLDTVSVAGMTIPPFDPAVRDGKLFGRGASDTKGPMAAALWALHEWAHSAARARSDVAWTFLGLMSEEAGQEGSRAVAESGFRSDLVLVLEPTSLGVVTAHKGVLWLEVETYGVACHGSAPQNGRNAIYAMRRVLEIIETQVIPELARRAHPALGPTTVNVGTIRGGSKINIVPDHCRIEIDCRLVPGVEAADVRTRIESLVRDAVPDARVIEQRHAAPLDTDESLPWVAKLGAVARGLTTAPWYSDAAVLGHAGCPAVCVGPGSIAQAHTKDEFISLRDLEEGTDFFRRWIEVVEQR